MSTDGEPECLEELLEALRQGDTKMETATRDLHSFATGLKGAEPKLSERDCLEYEAMTLVLGNVKDISELYRAIPHTSSLDQSNSVFSAPEYLELLFAAVADLEAQTPNSKIRWEETPWEKERLKIPREQSAVYDFYKHAHLLKACNGNKGHDLEVYAWDYDDIPPSSLSCTKYEASLRGVVTGANTLRSSQKSLSWIHVPYLAPMLLTVCRSIERALAQEGQNDRILNSHFRPCFNTPSIASGDLFLNYRDPIYRSFAQQNRKFSVVVFPSLALCSMRTLKRKREELKTMRHLLFPNVPEVPFYWMGVYLDRTLDETYYPGLDQNSLEERNRDQVVAREYTRTREFCHEADHPVLTVPQLWLWKLDSVLLSACSTNTSSHWQRGNTQHSDPNLSFTGGTGSQSLSIDLQIGHTIASHIEQFGKGSVDENAGTRIWYPPTLDMFETAVCSTLSDVGKYRKQATLDIDKEASFIHFVADLRSELHMIRSILKQQKQVLDGLIEDNLAESAERAKEDWHVVRQARKRLDEYDERISKIDGDAERVQGTIDAMLDLTRAHASMKDAKNSVIIGYVALGFAIVTIVFTPLSFVTSLYALPVDQFSQYQTSDKVYEYNFLKSVFIRAGFATVGGTLLLVLIIAFISDWRSTKAEYRKGYEEGFQSEWKKIGKDKEKEWEKSETTESTDKNNTEAVAKSTASWWNLRRRSHRKQHSQVGKVWHEA
ncbi:hypothetical protein K491DRAFT_754342 [Lophiostoma macrostomum CBS 122681]|uniref:Ankyrin repeat protein n=1 Tax=Lophiostoma macrostomum CBS 122681 TaxID=1314788 RepID=A0A6A6TPJ2_9PLEO|nr:hypothetical protein K491DRAFT_754342 [Lophiostoma macrostomum CBS 122681]